MIFLQGFMASASNSHLCHCPMALVSLSQLSLSPVPLTAFTCIPCNRDAVQSCVSLAQIPALCCPEGKQEHQPSKVQQPNMSP